MVSLKKSIRIPLFLLIVLLPAVLWIMEGPLMPRFATLDMATTSLGQLLGLTGMALMALVVILGARLKFLEDYYLGLNRIYINHHTLGGLALCLLLFHPLLLAIKYLVFSANSAAQFLLPLTNDWPKAFGIYALLLMIVLLVLTFYFSIRYDVWKFTHKFLGIVLALAFLHLIFITSDVSRNIYLKSYLVGFSGLAIAAVLYQVEQVKTLGGNIFEIMMRPQKEKIYFLPGQFGFFSFEQGGFRRETHPFSFASEPSAEVLRIIVKNLGDFTSGLGELKPGAMVKIEGPFGRFIPSGSKEQVWIAGGIGITPFLSMAQSLSGSSPKTDLYWCVKNPAEAVYLTELREIEKKNNNFKVILFCSDSEGRINAKIINDRSGMEEKDVYLCGPPAMMKSLKSQIKDLHFKIINIYSEEFSL